MLLKLFFFIVRVQLFQLLWITWLSKTKFYIPSNRNPQQSIRHSRVREGRVRWGCKPGPPRDNFLYKNTIITPKIVQHENPIQKNLPKTSSTPPSMNWRKLQRKHFISSPKTLTFFRTFVNSAKSTKEHPAEISFLWKSFR